jgi:hypothetical protein
VGEKYKKRDLVDLGHVFGFSQPQNITNCQKDPVAARVLPGIEVLTC